MFQMQIKLPIPSALIPKDARTIFLSLDPKEEPMVKAKIMVTIGPINGPECYPHDR